MTVTQVVIPRSVHEAMKRRGPVSAALAEIAERENMIKIEESK